jgi:hypothetical protein
MSKWRQAVFDRTEQDLVQRTAKAFLNVSDWLRIHGNTEQVQAFIRLMLSLDVELEPLTAPTVASFPSAGEINSLIENIDRLREAVSLPDGAGLVALRHNYVPGSGAEAPDYRAVNDWERDLWLVRDLLARALDYLVWPGVGNCGQPRFWQARFRAWPRYVKPVFVPKRMARCGVAFSGAPLARQNKWRGRRLRYPRCGVALTGTGLHQQNGFRRYRYGI